MKVKDPPWLGHEPLWLVAPHVPEWLKQAYTPVRIAPGCYGVWPLGRSFLWVAANDLPLRDELVPFLMARSGRALDEFTEWVAYRRPREWVLLVLKFLAMSTTVREDLLSRFAESHDAEAEARQERILEVLLSGSPQVRQRLVDEGIEKGIEEGRLAEARAALHRVLARRGFALSPDEKARIDACADLAMLERWLDQAVTAASVSEALR